jgi:hypothetical protein
MNPNTVQKYAHLLAVESGASPSQCWEAAARFTNACCWDERSGYMMIAKDGDGKCWNPKQGVVCDQITSRTTGQTFDMVANGGTPQQAAQFSLVEGRFIPDAQHVPPYDPASYMQPPVEATTPPPMPSAPPPYPPYPGDDAFDYCGRTLFEDYEEAKQAPNYEMSCWYGRVLYDWLTGICPTIEDSTWKHRNEWRGVLHLAPVQKPVG